MNRLFFGPDGNGESLALSTSRRGRFVLIRLVCPDHNSVPHVLSACPQSCSRCHEHSRLREAAAETDPSEERGVLDGRTGSHPFLWGMERRERRIRG
jgi:hypothetical protein